MLTLTESLPSGALIGGEGRSLARALAQTSGAWFAATPRAVRREGDRIVGWREASGAVVAAAVGPNIGNSQFDPGPPGAILCAPGVNCGFIIPDFAPEVDRFSAAVIYSSPKDEAKTLFAVSTGPSRNVIFLSEADGMLFATDRLGSFIVSIPVPARKPQPRLAIISFTGRGILMRCGDLTRSANGRAPEMRHPGQFLIGCRSIRPGLGKTLGLSRLHDVLCWPDRALLASSASEDLTVLAALDRYHRWTY